MNYTQAKNPTDTITVAMMDGNSDLSTLKHKKQGDYTQTYEVYGCADCSGCPHKSKCLYKYDEQTDADKNKMMKINEYWEFLLFSMGRNINKYHRFLQGALKKFDGKTVQTAA